MRSANNTTVSPGWSRNVTEKTKIAQAKTLRAKFKELDIQQLGQQPSLCIDWESKEQKIEE